MLRARKLAIGDEPVTDACRRGDVVAICIASDAAENTVRRFTRLSDEEKLPFLRLSYDKSALGGALGRANVAVVGIADVGFAARLYAFVADTAPDDDTVARTAAALRLRAERIVAEQKKKRAAEKAAAKKTPVAPPPPVKAPPPPKKAVDRSARPPYPFKKAPDAPARESVNREAPRKVYGKPPNPGKHVSLGDRRTQDAEKRRDDGADNAAPYRKAPAGQGSSQGARRAPGRATQWAPKQGSVRDGSRYPKRDAQQPSGPDSRPDATHAPGRPPQRSSYTPNTQNRPAYSAKTDGKPSFTRPSGAGKSFGEKKNSGDRPYGHRPAGNPASGRVNSAKNAYTGENTRKPVGKPKKTGPSDARRGNKGGHA